jgi:hypothetical protein
MNTDCIFSIFNYISGHELAIKIILFIINGNKYLSKYHSKYDFFRYTKFKYIKGIEKIIRYIHRIKLGWDTNYEKIDFSSFIYLESISNLMKICDLGNLKQFKFISTKCPNINFGNIVVDIFNYRGYTFCEKFPLVKYKLYSKHPCVLYNGNGKIQEVHISSSKDSFLVTANMDNLYIYRVDKDRPEFYLDTCRLEIKLKYPIKNLYLADYIFHEDSNIEYKEYIILSNKSIDNIYIDSKALKLDKIQLMTSSKHIEKKKFLKKYLSRGYCFSDEIKK